MDNQYSYAFFLFHRLSYVPKIVSGEEVQRLQFSTAIGLLHILKTYLPSTIVFFAAAVIIKLPELYEKPAAICYSDNPEGTAEISSANYRARNYHLVSFGFILLLGVFDDNFCYYVGQCLYRYTGWNVCKDANALCSGLFFMPFNFEAYEEATLPFRQIY